VPLVDPDDRGAEERAKQRDIVRLGYDAISHSYRDDAGHPNPRTSESTDKYAAWIAELAEMLPAGARVLDLGCGAGVPASRLLIERGFAVLGIDISEVQIERARRLVPDATFVQGDLVTWEAEPASFDAVICLYTLIHVPLEDQRNLLPRLRRWLRPNGCLLAIFGRDRWSAVEEYQGVPMFWDQADHTTYMEWLMDAGLVPLWDRFIPEGTSGHALVLARAQ
jgi:2-polyprenyl-3-methyl-5-hydroxy-6-metoxy-1,4-benzoquinol methylase